MKFWIWIEMTKLDWQSKSKIQFLLWIVNHNPIHQIGLQSSNTLHINYIIWIKTTITQLRYTYDLMVARPRPEAIDLKSLSRINKLFLIFYNTIVLRITFNAVWENFFKIFIESVSFHQLFYHFYTLPFPSILNPSNFKSISF